MSTATNRRVLLVDDMPTIHEDFRKILAPVAPQSAELSAVEAALFGDEVKVTAGAFELDSAYQGQEGYAKVQRSIEAGQPYAMAFVDMRMPPGWDGVQTIENLWRVDPRLQIVICTAYSDHSWDEVLARLDVGDRLLILKKPFDAIEVWQLAATLTTKWEATRQANAQLAELEEAVRKRTAEIMNTNAALQAEIRERKLLQVQLVQSEKLASIGQLAAGVAHEINNPISFVYSNFAALQNYHEKLFAMLAAYESAEHSLVAADTAAQLSAMRAQLELEFLKADIPMLMRESVQGVVRVRQIVQDLRTFSHVDSTPEWEQTDLHAGIDSTLNLLTSQIEDKAEVIKEYGTLPSIECLPSQINQVVLNILINACQAIGPELGTITIRTGTEGAEVWFEVIDTGSGIAPEVRDRIFEPFFTTKPVGLGTGLGLSLSYGIVQTHQGRIDLTSIVGQGTTFRVSLPIRRPASEAQI